MKAIMISDKPKWCALMMNGIKNIEVRRNKALANAIQKLIDEYGYAEIYVYCSKDKDILYENVLTNNFYLNLSNPAIGVEKRNGKVVFKFRCYKVEDYPYISDRYDELIGSCVSEKELLVYSTIKVENGIRFVKTIYAIHISKLEIFDKPKELSEFYKVGYLEEKYAIESHIADIEGCDGGVNEDYVDNLYEELDKQYQLTKAPQNFAYVEVE